MLRFLSLAFLVSSSAFAGPIGNYSFEPANSPEAALEQIRAIEDYHLLPELTPGGTAPQDPWQRGQWSQTEWQQTKTEELMMQETSGNYVRAEVGPAETSVFTVSTVNLKGERALRKATLSLNTPQYWIRNFWYRTLGYPHPATQHHLKFVIHFNSIDEKQSFLSRLESDTLAAQTRWVLAETETSVTLQDVILSNGTLGELPEPEMMVLQALTEMPENLNLIPWVMGEPEGRRYRIPFQANVAQDIQESELRKVLGRLAQLKRTDYELAVRRARLPHPVYLMLVEKLISRSEALLAFYEIEHDAVLFEPKINYFLELNDGVLASKKWPGYAGEFSYIEPKPATASPFELRLRLFTRTRLFSLLLGYAVHQFNQLPFMHTNIEKAFEDRESEILAQMTEAYNQTGEVQSRPLGTWGFGFASGQLILSRDVVAGNLMGTNHFLQIIDQVGLLINGGGQLNIDGTELPALTSVEGSLKGQVAISRTFAHIKPIRNLVEGNSPELRSLRLPFLLKRDPKTIDIQKLKTYLRVNESLVVTDSLVLNGAVRAALTLYGVANLSTTFDGKGIILNRVHIFRKDAETFQFHQDRATARQLMFMLQLGAQYSIPKFLRRIVSPANQDNTSVFPILQYQHNGQKGVVTTLFNSFKPKPGSRTLEILESSVMTGNLEVLHSIEKPVIITNEFKDRSHEGRALWWGNRRFKQNMSLSVEAPNGEKRNFIRDFFAKTIGRRFDRPMNQAWESLVRLATGSNTYEYNPQLTVNPGFTFAGKSKNQFLEVETEVDDKGLAQSTFIKLTHAYHGWNLKPKELRKIKEHFYELTGKKVEFPAVFDNAEETVLYGFNLHFYLSHEAVQALTQMTKNPEAYSGDQTWVAKRWMQRLDQIENQSAIEGDWIAQLGGPDSIRVEFEAQGVTSQPQPTSSAPNGETVLSQQVLMGGSIRQGPLSAERERWNMTEGEFLSQWIAGRVY